VCRIFFLKSVPNIVLICIVKKTTDLILDFCGRVLTSIQSNMFIKRFYKINEIYVWDEKLYFNEKLNL